jgi:hypothetical protein
LTSASFLSLPRINPHADMAGELRLAQDLDDALVFRAGRPDFAGHGPPVDAVDGIERQSKWVATGLNHQLAILNATSGQETRRLAPVTPTPPQTKLPSYRHVLFTPDGKRIVAVQDLQAWLTGLPQNEKVARLVDQLAENVLAKRLGAIQALGEMKKDPTVEAHLVRAALKPDAVELTRLCALSLLEAYYQPTTPEYVNLLRVIKLSEWLGDQPARERLKLFGERLPTQRGSKQAREALKRIEAGTHCKEFDALPPLPKPADTIGQRQPLRILAPKP